MRGRTRKHKQAQRQRTRKRQRKQHGGSRRQLDLYTSPKQMRADMSFYLVGAHGGTTYDKKFMLVPKDTYILFTTHSGTTAPSEFPELGDMVQGLDKDTYYNTLYERIFTKGGLKYPEDYFIYEPGDLLPDYNLGFRNNGYFVSKMGVYKLPLRNLLPGAKTEYYGRIISTIRRMLDNGTLKESDIEGLTGEMAEDIRTKTPEELQKKFYLDTFSQIVAPSVMFWRDYRKELQVDTGAEDWDIEVLDRHPPPYERLPLLDKIEQYTTYTKDNLVRDLILPSKNFNIRMSNVLASVGLQKSKKRFFVMSFCRDSYEDAIDDYVRSVQPRMLRALSFSQKCGRGATSEDDTVLNLVRMVDAFCSYPIKRRAELLETATGRKFVALVKKIVPADWTECLSGAYDSLNDIDRYDLLSNYVGYLTADQLFELSGLADGLAGFPKLGRPLQRLYDDLQRFESVLEKTAAKKRSIIEGIYKQLDKAHGVGYRRTPKGMKVKDFLNLSASSVGLLQELETLVADQESAFMKPMAGNSVKEVEDFLKESLAEFMGREGGRDYDPFPATEKEDKSIEFRGNSNTE